MVKIIFACLFLTLGLWGCDGDERNCIDIPQVRESDCLAPDLQRVCRDFGGISCKAVFPDESIAVFFPDRQPANACLAVDCETIECSALIFRDLHFTVDDMIRLEGKVVRVSDDEEGGLEDCLFVAP